MKRTTNRLTLFVCFLLQVSSSTWVQRADAETASDEQVIKPQLLGDDIPLNNPISGFYGEYDLSPANAAPLPVLPREQYEEIQWSCLENNGRFNFSFIEDTLNKLPAGVKFAFRVKAFDHQVRNGKCNLETLVPSDLATESHGWRLPYDLSHPEKGYYFVPDWNDPIFLNRVARLLTELGKRYDGDRRLAWIDIGIYGTWGEWHTGGLPNHPHGIPYNELDPGYSYNLRHFQPATSATKRFIIDAHVKAFPKTQLVMMTGPKQNGDAFCYAMKLEGQERHIGLRRDGLGSSTGWYASYPDHYTDCHSPEDTALLLKRWESAPFIAEPFGNKPTHTFDLCPQGEKQQYCIEPQVESYHIATVDDSDLGAGADGKNLRWSDLSTSEQQAFLRAGYRAGYRLAPVEIHVRQQTTRDAARKLIMTTHWSNSGVAPTYNDWNVEISLWTQPSGVTPATEVSRTTSQVQLRKLLPTGQTPLLVTDGFELGREVKPGAYEVKIKVVDPQNYMKPMQLALQAQEEDGGYWLGRVVVQ